MSTCNCPVPSPSVRASRCGVQVQLGDPFVMRKDMANLSDTIKAGR